MWEVCLQGYVLLNAHQGYTTSVDLPLIVMVVQMMAGALPASCAVDRMVVAVNNTMLSFVNNPTLRLRPLVTCDSWLRSIVSTRYE